MRNTLLQAVILLAYSICRPKNPPCLTYLIQLIQRKQTAVLQYLPRLTIIDYIKLLADSAAAAAAGAIDTQLSENWQSAPAILSNLIDKLTTETASKSLRIKQFEAERRKQQRARAERRASLTERELIERRKQRIKQVQAQKTNLKMFIKALSVEADEASFSQKVLKMADLIDNDLDLWFTCFASFIINKHLLNLAEGN